MRSLLLLIVTTASSSYAKWGALAWGFRTLPRNAPSQADYRHSSIRMRDRTRDQFQKQQIIDAEYENYDEKATAFDEEVEDGTADSRTLADLFLDPDLRVPFVEGGSNSNYIDVKLAFMVKLDGVDYGVGIPFDHTAAIAVEKKDGSLTYLSPDSDDNEELMEIMANQLHQHVGADLMLKRTPRVLTIAGPLEQYVKDWKTALVPKPFSADELLTKDAEVTDEQFFHQFMKETLGEEEYEKTMQESDEVLSDELKSYFDVPGLGDRSDDKDGVQELLQSLLDPVDKQQTILKDLEADIDQEGLALKLFSCIIPGDSTYSLVHLLRPCALVGRFSSDDTSTMSFNLLSVSEEKVLIPRLECVCRKDLESAGIRF